MGLIRAALGAVGSTLKDQWKEVISCGNLDNDTLMMMQTTQTGVITKNSIVRVMPGQCAVIIQNGKVLDATAEAGDYTFEASTSPSFFAGEFGSVFKEMWQRFTFGGASAGQQAVYFFNTKEITGNKFGTTEPVSFKDWTYRIPNKMTGGVSPLPVKVTCHGTYTFKIDNPAVFMQEIAGTATVYKKQQIIEQMRSEVIGTLVNLLNEIGRVDKGSESISVLDLPSQTDEIKQMMDEMVFDEPIRARGLRIKSFVIEGVNPDKDSEEKINNYNLSSNSDLQQGTLVGAYADAIKDAANNSNGAGTGFMNIGMMNMASGGVFGGATQNVGNQANQNTQQPQVSEKTSWICPKCGKENTGKFCDECGEKKPEAKCGFCPECGEKVVETAKFCPSCGTKLQ